MLFAHLWESQTGTDSQLLNSECYTGKKCSDLEALPLEFKNEKIESEALVDLSRDMASAHQPWAPSERL